MASVNIYRLALILTLVLVALDTAGNIVLILFPTCYISIKEPTANNLNQLTLGDFFYSIYLAGPYGNGTGIDERRCAYTNGVTVTETFHFQCNPDIGSDPIPMPYPREETNSSSVIFWAAAFLVVDVLWAVSALFLDGRIAGCSCADTSKKPGMPRVQLKPYYIPWGVTTALVLMFNLAAGIVFAVDMQYPINYIKNDACSNDKLATGAYLGATTILPLWFGRFIILWFAVLVVWVMVMSDGKKNMRFDTDGDKVNGGLKNTRARSTPSASTANFRDNSVPNYNDDRPDNMMATTTFTGGHVDDGDRVGFAGGKIRRSNSRQARGYGYDNDAFDTEYPEGRPSSSYGYDDPRAVSHSANWSFGGQPGPGQPGPRQPGGPQLRRVSPPSLPRRESLTSPMQGGNPIGSYQRRHRPHDRDPPPHHRLSDNSEISEIIDRSNRRIGRPQTAPVLPKPDYVIPRASARPPSVSSYDGHGGHVAVSRQTSGMLRTPSGRASSAVEYLGRDYYTPRNNSRQQGGVARPAARSNIREYGPYGDDDVDRYYVKLKD